MWRMKFEFNWPNDFWVKNVLIHWWNSNILRSLYIKFEFNWPSGFRGEDVWKCWWTAGCWGRMTDRASVTGIILAHPWAFRSDVWLKIVEHFSDINFIICFGCSKEPSHWDDSFEYLNHMFWKIRKVILNCTLFFYYEAYYCLNNFIATILLHGIP